MKRIEFAHEILSESRRSTQIYLESGRDYDKVKANMYSIFECYAHGLITWNQVRTRWHSSIVEYLNLYADRPDLYLSESSRMLGEYETTLQTFKPALDEYKRVNEQKMVSNIVVKGKLNESQAKEHSNVYFNRRSLKESELKDTTTMKTWKRVQESYPNLTSKDEMRIRMLTIFEGSTVDTTKLVTTYMSEEPTTISGPMQTSMRPKPRPANLGNTSTVDSASIDAAVKQAFGQGTAPTTSPRPMPRPAGQSIGAGSQVAYMDNGAVDGSTRGIDPADAYSPEDLARLTGQPAPSLAPTTSPRPMPRPTTLKQSANNNIRKEAAAIFSKIKATANEGYKVLPPMDKERYTEIPGLEGPFTTLSGKVVYYDPKEGAYYDRDTDMYLSNDEYTALNSDYSGMQDERDIKIREAKKVKPGHNARVMAKAQDTVRKSIEKSKKEDDDKKDKVDEAVAKIACVKCDEVSTAAAWKKNNGFCPKCKTSSQGVAESASKAASFKLKVTNPATGNSETQEFNSETALKDYTARAKQKGLKVSRIKSTNEATDWSKDLAVQAIQSKLKKAKVSYRDPNAKNAREEDRIAKMLAAKAKKKNESVDLDEGDTDDKMWKVSYDHGPHQSNTIKVKAKSQSHAWEVAKEVAKKEHGHARITSGSVTPVKEETEVDEAGSFSYGKKKPKAGSLKDQMAKQSKKYWDEQPVIEPKDQKVGNAKVTKESVAESYTGRETKEGTWRVFKTGDAVAVAGPFKSKEEASAWIKKQSSATESTVKESSSFKLKVTNPATGNSEVQEFNSETALNAYKDRATQKGLKVSRVNDESVVNEAVTLDYSRYMRAHGKKPRDAGYAGVWMFTTSEFGDPSEDETFEFRGSFADAKKAAAKWAKSQGENRFYVME